MNRCSDGVASVSAPADARTRKLCPTPSTAIVSYAAGDVQAAKRAAVERALEGRRGIRRDEGERGRAPPPAVRAVPLVAARRRCLVAGDARVDRVRPGEPRRWGTPAARRCPAARRSRRPGGGTSSPPWRPRWSSGCRWCRTRPAGVVVVRDLGQSGKPAARVRREDGVDLGALIARLDGVALRRRRREVVPDGTSAVGALGEASCSRPRSGRRAPTAPPGRSWSRGCRRSAARAPDVSGAALAEGVVRRRGGGRGSRGEREPGEERRRPSRRD